MGAGAEPSHDRACYPIDRVTERTAGRESGHGLSASPLASRPADVPGGRPAKKSRGTTTMATRTRSGGSPSAPPRSVLPPAGALAARRRPAVFAAVSPACRTFQEYALSSVTGEHRLSGLLREPDLAVRDGCLRVPDGPGLGVEIDEDRLAELRSA